MQITIRTAKNRNIRTKPLEVELASPTTVVPVRPGQQLANIFFVRVDNVPMLGFETQDARGQSYEVRLTDGDLNALMEARVRAYAGEKFGWDK